MDSIQTAIVLAIGLAFSTRIAPMESAGRAINTAILQKNTSYADADATEREPEWGPVLFVERHANRLRFNFHGNV